MSQAWQQKTIALPFRFGELQLFTVKFPALVKSGALEIAASSSPLPLNRLRTSVKAIVTGSDPIERALPKVTMLKEAIRYVPRQYRRFYIDLTGTFADYEKHFSRKRRGNLRREARVFAKASGGDLHWRTFQHSGEIAEFHHHACEISQRTYQHRLWEKGIPQSKEFVAHLKDSAARGQSRGYLLYFQGQPQAYAYFEAQGPILEYHYTGYNPDLRQYSPGSVLLYLIVEQLFAHREFQALDFTEGEAWYKESFATGHVRCADIYYFRKNWFGATTVAAHCAVASLSRSGALLADKCRLKSTLKRLIRHAA
jgi:CelD/BcsL family acetyltransferase involved in cellulose biosynthesis